MKKVVKRDGSLEDFDTGKIVRIMKAAGLDDAASKILASSVERWFSGQKEDGISSLRIRDEVLSELKKVNSYAAGLYEWYERTKEKTTSA